MPKLFQVLKRFPVCPPFLPSLSFPVERSGGASDNRCVDDAGSCDPFSKTGHRDFPELTGDGSRSQNKAGVPLLGDVVAAASGLQGLTGECPLKCGVSDDRLNVSSQIKWSVYLGFNVVVEKLTERLARRLRKWIAKPSAEAVKKARHGKPRYAKVPLAGEDDL